MALLYRHSPTYLGTSRRAAAGTSPAEPSLRPCVSCSLTCLVPAKTPPETPPLEPPPYEEEATPPPPSRSPGSPTFTISSRSSEYEWRSHDHPTVFVRCAGHVSPASTKKSPSSSAAGVGVSFASPSRYDLAEPIPTSVSLAGGKRLPITVTPNRAEIFAAIQALDRFKTILHDSARDRSENGGWESGLGGMFDKVGGGSKKRLEMLGITLPGKVEEIVVLTRSEYLISAITAPTSDKPWRSTPEGQRRFAASAGAPPVINHSRGKNASLTSLSSTTSTSSKGQKRRAWLSRKGTKARKADYDLLFELDLLVAELGDRYGVRVCFHKAVVGEAARLARRGAGIGEN